MLLSSSSSTLAPEQSSSSSSSPPELDPPPAKREKFSLKMRKNEKDKEIVTETSSSTTCTGRTPPPTTSTCTWRYPPERRRSQELPSEAAMTTERLGRTATTTTCTGGSISPGSRRPLPSPLQRTSPTPTTCTGREATSTTCTWGSSSPEMRRSQDLKSSTLPKTLLRRNVETVTVTSKEEKDDLKMINDRKMRSFDSDKTLWKEARRGQEDSKPRQEEEDKEEEVKLTYLPGSRLEVGCGMRPDVPCSSPTSSTASRVTTACSGGTASPGGGGRDLRMSSLVSTLISNINTFHADKPRLPRISAEHSSTVLREDDQTFGGGTATRTARGEQDFRH